MMKNPILLLLWLAGGKILLAINVAALTVHKLQWLSRLAHDNPSLFERRNIDRQQSERRQKKDPSRLYSTSTNVNHIDASRAAAPASISSDTEIRGLLPTSEFRRRQALHKTLRLLQKQLPVLLTRPLSERDAFETYTDDTKLIIKVDGSDTFELVNSREELVSILEAVVLTITVASSTAESFFSNLASVTTPPSKDDGQNKIDPSTSRKNVVECQILIEPEHFLRIVSDGTDDLTIEVDWEVNLISVLPGIGSSTLGSTSKKVDTEQGYSPSSARTGSRSFNVTRPRVASAKLSPSSDAWSQSSSKPQSSTSSASQRRIRGTSILTLDSKSDYKVSCHQIVNIRWNEVDVDRAAIGQTLSILRQATQLVSKQAAAVAPIPFLSQATNIWNQVKDEVIARQKTTTASTDNAEYMAPILIPVPTKLQKDGKSFSNAADEAETATRIPINEFMLPKTNESNIDALYMSLPCPLPGSKGWSDYAAVYRASRNFVQFAIPTLSGGRNRNDEPVLYESSLFTPTAQLIASDGNVLLRDAKRLDNFYQSLVSLRKISNGKWLLNNVSIVDYYFESDDFGSDRKAIVMLQVEYSTLLHVPAAGTIVGSSNSGYDISIEGTDLFAVSFNLSAQERDDIEVNDRDIDLVPSFISSLRIERVEQKKLSLNSGAFGDAFTIKSNPQDNIWFMKNLVAAVESGSLPSIDSSTSFLLDMVSRLRNRASSSKKIEQVLVPSQSNRERPGISFLGKKSTPRRSDESAVIVYRIMESLHADLPKLLDPSTIASRGRQVPPANDYLNDDIQLLGYLDEVLLRGRLQYSQSIGMLITALQTALRSGSFVSEKDPVVIVELTPRGNIRLSFSIFLKLSHISIGPFSDSTVGNALVDAAADRLSPLHIRLVSEYILNQDTGLIEKHRLLESRVNGQLTPADVVSRWIQRVRSGFSPSSRIQDDEIGVDAPWVRNLVLDTVNWMLSINK